MKKNFMSLNNIGKKELEELKQLSAYLNTPQGKMVLSLSSDKETLLEIDKLDKQIDELDEKIYQSLIDYMGKKNIYDNDSSKLSLIDFITMRKESDFLGSTLLNLVNVFKLLDGISKGDIASVNFFDTFTGSKINEARLLLKQRKEIEDEKQKILNQCIENFDKISQSPETQEFMKIISDSMIGRRF